MKLEQILSQDLRCRCGGQMGFVCIAIFDDQIELEAGFDCFGDCGSQICIHYEGPFTSEAEDLLKKKYPYPLLYSVRKQHGIHFSRTEACQSWQLTDEGTFISFGFGMANLPSLLLKKTKNNNSKGRSPNGP